MESENLTDERPRFRKLLLYCVCTVGALLTKRQRIDPRSPESKPLDLSTPEGRKIGLAALNGFASRSRGVAPFHVMGQEAAAPLVQAGCN
jgi:hypothetical protein